LADLIAYTVEQQENETLLQIATDILCKLATNANIYLLSVFNQADTGVKLKGLIEANIFHSRDQIAFSVCLLATTLLVAQSKTSIDRNAGVDIIDVASTSILDELFELTKSGLFSMVLDCDAYLEAHENEKNLANNESKSRLLKVSIIVLT
jgi:hypothetical protein